jgi:hypothetical protein
LPRRRRLFDAVGEAAREQAEALVEHAEQQLFEETAVEGRVGEGPRAHDRDAGRRAIGLMDQRSSPPPYRVVAAACAATARAPEREATARPVGSAGALRSSV